MSRFYTAPKNHPQEETAYCICRVIESCFGSARCPSWFLRDRLYLYYRDAGEKRNAPREAEIREMVFEQAGSFLDLLRLMRCETHVSFRKGMYLLRFVTGFEEFRAEVAPDGKYSIRFFR